MLLQNRNYTRTSWRISLSSSTCSVLARVIHKNRNSLSLVCCYTSQYSVVLCISCEPTPGKITIRGRSTAVNADFARQASFVAQKLNVSDLHIAEVMYGVTHTYPNLPPETLIERTVVAFHKRRRDIAECLRYIFFAAEQSSNPDAPQLFKRLDTFLRQHLLPPTKPQELPLASKLFREIEALEGVLNSTLNARQCAGSDTIAPPNPGTQ